MKNLYQVIASAPLSDHKEVHADLYERIINYYQDAGPDYRFWSKNYNMHFGYGRIKDIFSREKMLKRMNAEVLKSLDLNCINESKYVLDMGCGLGATLRQAAKDYPKNFYAGITLVPWQVERAKELNRKEKQNASVYIMEADYLHVPFPDKFFDRTFAIESSCHSPGEGKEYFIREMKRILKPGGKFVIADAFIKKSPETFSPLIQKFYKSICESWALPNIGQLEKVKRNLLENGFRNIRVKDISWRVAPSVLHSPFVILRFGFMNWIRGEKIKEQSKKNLIGSFSSLMLGLSRDTFGYYLISGES